MEQIREAKVVFLGTDGSGKSKAMERLMACGGMSACGCDHISPRGISVYHRSLMHNGSGYRLHFWVFGRDAARRSLERPFLTDRTVYVVFLNVREGNEEKTARRWLRLLAEYGPHSPVILLLNSDDQLQKTVLDERTLRTEYPNLKDVFQISVGYDPDAVIESRLKYPLLARIEELTAGQGLTGAQQRVVRQLWERPEERISMECFQGLCRDQNVGPEQQRELLQRCTELGACTWRDAAGLRDHIILRQEWLLNGIHAVLQESDARDGRGVISRDSMYSNILCHGGAGRIDEHALYREADARLIGDVMMEHQMLYELRRGKVFLPGICRSQMSEEAEEDLSDPRNMEIKVTLRSSAEMILFELMKEVRHELGEHAVWTEGFRLTRGDGKLSAVIRADGNVLRISVRSRDSRQNVPEYMDQLLQILYVVLEDFGLDRKKLPIDLIYRRDGVAVELIYRWYAEAGDDREMPIRVGNEMHYVKRGEIRRSYGAQEALIPMDPEDDELICDVLRACEKMQVNITYRGVKENVRNRYVHDILSNKWAQYTVQDQPEQGEGATGNGPGEVDILFKRKRDNSQWTIFEGLNIKRGFSERSKWEQHLLKLLHRYDKTGLKFLLLTAFTECDVERWLQIWRDYELHMTTYCPEGIIQTGDTEAKVRYELVKDSCQRYEPEDYIPGNKMKVAQCIYEIGGMRTKVVHIFVRFDKAPKTSKEGKEEGHESVVEEDPTPCGASQ